MAIGVEKGDRVGIWSSNRFEWVLIQFATARIGAILVNVNPAYKAQELSFAMKQSEISVLVMSKGFRKTSYIEILNKVKSEFDFLREVIVLEEDWEQLINDGNSISDDELNSRESKLEFDDPINIQYTSGTTGFPKGATLSHHNILNNGFFVGERLGYTGREKVCIPVPLYHCFGMVLGNIACTTHGACMILTGEAFEATRVLEIVEAEKATSLYGVPDEKYGEQVMAWIVLKENAQVSTDALKAYCQGQIATYKIPYYWKFVNDFPTTVTGNIRKVEMREMATKELGLSELV